MVSMSKITIFMVICVVVAFDLHTHAQDVSGPVCKWDYSTNTCEKDPSKMIQLLTNTNEMFGLLMRCQYATTQSTCNNMSQNTCTWENNSCQISSKKLINQINDCFQKNQDQNEIILCKNELQNISENTTWINKKQVRPASSCKETVVNFSYSTDTCIVMQYALQCTSYSGYGCTYGNTDTQAYQLVSDLRYIMGISSLNISISLSFLENQLDIKSGILQLYNRCNEILQRSKCEYQTSYYSPPSPSDYTPSLTSQYSYMYSSSRQIQKSQQRSLKFDNNNKKNNNNDDNYAVIIVPCLVGFLAIAGVCGVFVIIRCQNERNVTNSVDGTSQNVEIPARTTNQQQTEGIEAEATIEIIERLPNLEFKGVQSSEAICCICLERLQVGDASTVLECAHWFHKECLNEWIRTKGRNVSCPLCNNTLQNNTTQQQQL